MSKIFDITRKDKSMFRKKDEMELRISNKAMRIAWFSTVIILFTIGFIQAYQNGETRNIFLVLASLSVIINLVTERYYLAKMNEDRSFVKFILLALGFIALFVLALWLSS